MRPPSSKALLFTFLGTASLVFLAGWWLERQGVFTLRKPMSATVMGAVASRAPASTEIAGGGKPKPLSPDSPLVSEEMNESALNEEIRRGNPCAALVWAMSSEQDGPDVLLAKLAEVLAELGSPEPRLEELARARRHPDTYGFAEDLSVSEIETSRFFAALAATGQIHAGIRHAQEDWALGYRLLEKLMADNIENGVYACYYAAAMRKQGSAPQSYLPWLERCSEAPNYDFHTAGLARSILSASRKSPAARVLAEYALGYLPVPDHAALLEPVREMMGAPARGAEDGPDGSDRVYRIGRRLMDNVLSQTEGRESVDWFQTEFAVGRALAKSAFADMNPEPDEQEREPEVLSIRPRDLVSDVERERQARWSAAWDDLLRSPSVKECRTGLLTKYIETESRGASRK